MLPASVERGTLMALIGGAPLTNQHPSLQALRQIRSYAAFKAYYIQLEPELTNSPAFLQALMAVNGFDWLERLVEETFEEERASAAAPQARPQTQARAHNLPLAA